MGKEASGNTEFGGFILLLALLAFSDTLQKSEYSYSVIFFLGK